MTSRSDHRVRPWEIRFVQALPLPDWQMVVAIAGFVSLVTLLVTALATPLEEPRTEIESRLPYILAVVLGYLLASLRYGIVRLRADIDDLRPFFTGSEADYADVMRSITHQPRMPLRGAGALGMLLAIVIPEVFLGRFTRLFLGGDWNLVDLWMIVYAALFWWIFLRVLAVVVFHLLMLRQLGSTRIEIGLFDRRPGRPFARIAMRWIVMALAIPFVIFGIGLAWGAVLPMMALAVMLMNFALMVAALLLPVSGLRQIIRAAKKAELALVERAIAGDPEALASSMIGADADRIGIVDLLAYRREIEAVREWPYDNPALTRFVIVLLLPIVSWILSALVERLVDAILTG
jgi:hypothetical protein